jgi:hypothetical protein
MVRSEVYIDSQEILTLESFPPQFRLHVIGSLPTPCHKLRAVVYEPDEQNQIHVQIFSWVDPDIVCAQVLQALDASIPLGSYASGSYRVFVNGAEVGQINPLISEGSTLRGHPPRTRLPG